MHEIVIQVPKELTHPFFFPGGEISWNLFDQTCFNPQKPFIYEAAYFHEMESLIPWSDTQASVKELLDEWDKTKDALQASFKKRERQAAAIQMKVGLGIFIEFLFWSNGQPVILYPKIDYRVLPIQPVNLHERLEFILSRPTLYHSYMQLVELMKEMEKAYEKAKALNNKKKSV
jgi:hypothetical protein